VTKVVTFGAFVEILDGVEGLVHISELAAHHVENPREIVQPGDELRVKILEIDSERRRLSLSAKRVEGQVLPVRRIEPEGEEGEQGALPAGSEGVAEIEAVPVSAEEGAEPQAAVETAAPEAVTATEPSSEPEAVVASEPAAEPEAVEVTEPAPEPEIVEVTEPAPEPQAVVEAAPVAEDAGEPEAAVETAAPLAEDVVEPQGQSAPEEPAPDEQPTAAE
jgi:small subunit ribosomal protein S1